MEALNSGISTLEFRKIRTSLINFKKKKPVTKKIKCELTLICIGLNILKAAAVPDSPCFLCHKNRMRSEKKWIIFLKLAGKLYLHDKSIIFVCENHFKPGLVIT